jgi:hypothetical protein
MSDESARRSRSIDDIFAECWENAKPFHEREIAAIITGVALQEPNLLGHHFFQTASELALAKFKMKASAHGLKKPFFAPWEKFMVSSTLNHPGIFALLAPFIALSASGKQGEAAWDGTGRVIDAKTIENLRALRELEKRFGLPPDRPPSRHFIEIFIGPYMDRLKDLLEAAS